MGSDDRVMGIPQLIHFQTLVTTGALFLGIVAVRVLEQSAGIDSLLLTAVIACLALGLLIFSADFFIEGAKGGFSTAIKIIPYLVGILVAIGIFRSCGAMDYLVAGISWFFSLFVDNSF